MSGTPSWRRSAVELAAELAAGSLRSVELVEALFARADATEPVVGGYAIQRREEALREAAARDAERRAGRVRGPLHGLPLTVKENLDLEGQPTTLGLAARRGERASADALIVSVAKRAGMIVLGKSNLPQALVSGMECDNPLFGVTRNPHRASHGPGGSSGGEAALLATGASVLGLGTDLGGSIRSPAAYCGVTGLKPTLGRWSTRGVRSFLPGQEIVRSTVGPMARTVAELELFFCSLSVAEQAAEDPLVAPVPHDSVRLAGLDGLRVGVFDHDGFLEPAAAIRRAVRDAAAALAARGASLVDFPPEAQPEMLALYVAAVSSDGLVTARGALAREPSIADTMRELWWASSVPEPLRRAGALALRAAGERRLAGLIGASRRRDVAGYWALAEQRRAFAQRELDRWNAARIDVVLSPVGATPAVPIGMSRGLAWAFSYTARHNLSGFPAGVVSTSRVRASDALRPQRGDRIERVLARVDAASRGLPVAVQLVGRPYAEPTLLAVLRHLEEWARAESDPCEVPVRVPVLAQAR
ncbi:MAG: amidase [Polyangiaceae bacterium]|nr:amidase [Polyangiaceae bacterium]